MYHSKLPEAEGYQHTLILKNDSSGKLSHLINQEMTGF